jgi:protein-L-isoaspartate(D-aspartate) O-methyltransferase
MPLVDPRRSARRRARGRQRTAAYPWVVRRQAAVSLVVVMIVLSACGAPGPRDELLTPPLAGGGTDTPTATGPATTSDASAPSGSPLDAGELDREFADSDEFRQRREELVALISRHVEDERVVAAMQQVPRHSFVPTSGLDRAYADHPLPIGYGQTISQPSLVGRMTELLELESGERVLEIGTGSGYQAAILGELTDEVYSVEIVPELGATGRAVLDELGYATVTTDRRDGYLGWPENAPYDAIIVTAAPDHLPQPLVEQLNEDGGRMIIPIGPVGDVQTLWLVTKENGEPRMERLLDVRFVPLVREGE